MHQLKIFVFVVFAALGGFAPFAANAAQTTRLVIDTTGGPRTFNVEVAANDQQRQVGLMFRKSLPVDGGMLFEYHSSQPVAMWMKNTLIPLDMLFIKEDGRVHRIAERTVPHSLESIESGGPVRAVLELNAGTAARLGIRPGDLVRHAIFKNLGP